MQKNHNSQKSRPISIKERKEKYRHQINISGRNSLFTHFALSSLHCPTIPSFLSPSKLLPPSAIHRSTCSILLSIPSKKQHSSIKLSLIPKTSPLTGLLELK